MKILPVLSVLLGLLAILDGIPVTRTRGFETKKQIKGVVKTIKSKDGDIIDCIDIYKQPAFDHPALNDHKIQSIDGDIIDCIDIYKQSTFDHPLLNGHKIQMQPSQGPNAYMRNFSVSPTKQVWQRSGTCPKGTIPVRRSSNNNISRTPIFQNLDGNNPGSHTELAIAYSLNSPYRGVGGMIYTWNIYVEPNEFSLNLIFCANNNGTKHESGRLPDSLQNFVTVGWAVYPELFGDSRTRLFAAWTRDNLAWCFNIGCEGFVQVSNKIALGAAIDDTSVYGDPEKQAAMDVVIYRDSDVPRWWVVLNDENIGYFPERLFSNFWDCDLVAWGGAILNNRGTGGPTRTMMGNGHYSREGYSKAGMIRDAYITRPRDGISVDPPSGYTLTRDSCYTLANLGKPDPQYPGYTYLYGGPGANSPSCH